MIWAIISIVVGYVLLRFFLSLNKDNDDLQNQTLAEKFGVIVSVLNDGAYNGRGKITSLDNREFNLYQEGSNQIIKFQYGTGILTITWKYKYFQKEVVYERQFSNARNLSIFDQQKIAEQLMKGMMITIEKHKIDVIGSTL